MPWHTHRCRHGRKVVACESKRKMISPADINMIGNMEVKSRRVFIAATSLSALVFNSFETITGVILFTTAAKESIYAALLRFSEAFITDSGHACTILKVGVFNVVLSTGISCRFSTRVTDRKPHARYTIHGSELEQSFSIKSADCALYLILLSLSL